jgi:hypothetical protein
MADITSIFPVMNRECKNGIFEPLSHWSKENWRNRNRRNWTCEELKNLFSDHADIDDRELSKNYILLYNFPRSASEKDGDLLNTTRFVKDTIFIGKIIKMGNYAFDKGTFPTGAIASYGDWVHYDLMKSVEKYGANKQLVLIKDTDIIGLARDPLEFNYF